VDERDREPEEANGEAADGVPAPATVWLVSRETGQLGWEGILSLDPDAVTFMPMDRGAPRSFPLGEIKKAHRVMGSPVLELRLAPTATQRLVGFYFVRPPDLNPGRNSTTPRPLQKRNARKRAVLTLRVGNDAKRDDIKGWVSAIRAAMAARRPGA
jgi:hypothetical protein